MRIPSYLLLGWICVLASVGRSSAQELSARRAFGAFTGKWQGIFRTFAFDGTLLDSLRVQHRISWSGDTQKVVITDRYSDGRVVVSHGENFVRGDTLFCGVRKPDGSRTALTGKVSDGRLFWSRVDEAAGVQEVFKEYVGRTREGAVYFIDGVGVYGSGPRKRILLFEGRYLKVE